ncbi:L,D-transpeptidase [Mangrovibrevibacter kandeliae]|uniref:L,D-transpeptidase n=1 Tax=Mangrovibrevibacter kandeliae TaxID=2968473 RepID=UPI002117FF91|nr:L,D-transpeptidase [Aurantimonas sp. CSK15Z-1]MCQ8780810.1 L,D-transpeptidase [Aurantimonas sp. CSK15Z-1]
MFAKHLVLALCAGVIGFGALQPAKAEELKRYNYATGQWETYDPSRLRHTVRQVPSEFRRKNVRIETAEAPGTIIVDTQRKFLYFVQGDGKAVRYGVGVGREGFGWSGVMKIGRKAEWPGWTPPPEMVVRERKQGHILPAYMEGGPDNPLGARAMYLYRNGHDSQFRIHGTNQPWTIGLNMSSGCIRMMNEDVTNLYGRADVGAKVVVIGPNGEGRDGVYREKGFDLLATIFGG